MLSQLSSLKVLLSLFPGTGNTESGANLEKSTEVDGTRVSPARLQRAALFVLSGISLELPTAQCMHACVCVCTRVCDLHTVLLVNYTNGKMHGAAASCFSCRWHTAELLPLLHGAQPQHSEIRPGNTQACLWLWGTAAWVPLHPSRTDAVHGVWMSRTVVISLWHFPGLCFKSFFSLWS